MSPLEPLQPQTVLIVDDAPENLKLMGGLLKDRYRIKVAGNGEKALEIAAAQPVPDLILLDVMMPGMDGLTVNRTLAADARLKHIPVVIISALGRSADIQAGLETGVHAYLVKPFSPWELLDVVDKLTGKTPADGEPRVAEGRA